MVSCAVLGCDSSKNNNPQKYSFHQFPLNPDIREQWMHMLNRQNWSPHRYSTICSKHFHEHCFIPMTKRRKLRSGSVPTLHMPDEVPLPPRLATYQLRDIKSVPGASTSAMSNTSSVTAPLKPNLLKTITILKRRIIDPTVEDCSPKQQKGLTQDQGTELNDGYPSVKEEPADYDADFENNMAMDSDYKESTPLHRTQCKDEVMLHEQYHCDVCSGEIRGFRYTCVQCSDLDLCGACEATAAHNQHYVLRVPQSRPSMEIQFVLATIRQHLMKKVDPLSEPNQDCGDVVNIKSEMKSEPEDETKCNEFGAYPSTHSEITPSYNPLDYDNEESIDTSEEEAPCSNLNSTVGVATASAAVHTASILHAPDLFNTAKNKSHINLQDFIKAQDASMPANKTLLMPVPITESNKNITVCKPHIEIRPGINLLKLPPGTVLKSTQKVPTKSTAASEDIKNEADNR